MSQVKRSVVANMVGKACSAVVTLVTVPLYMRLLGPEAYGLIGLYTTLQIVFSLLDMGLSMTVNREMARLSVQEDAAGEMRDLTLTLQAIYWLIALVIALAVLAAAPQIANHWVRAQHLTQQTIRAAVAMMGLTIALQFPFALYQGGLLGLQRQIRLNVILVTTGTLQSFGALAVLWWVSRTIQAFYAWQVLAVTAQTLISAVALWSSLPRSVCRSRVRPALLYPLWRFAAGMAGTTVLGTILMQLDKIILSKLLPLAKFGYYALAATAAGSLYLLVQPVFAAVFPRYSQLVALKDEAGLRACYHLTCQLLSVLLLPATIVFALFAPEILGLWARDPIIVTNTHLLVSILVVGNALNGLLSLPYALQLAHGQTRLAFWANLVAVIVIGPLIYSMAHRYGALSTAGIWAGLNLTYVLFGMMLLHRLFLPGELKRWYLTDVLRPLLAAMAIALPCRWLLPNHLGMLMTLVCLALILLTALTVSALATPAVNARLRAMLADTNRAKTRSANGRSKAQETQQEALKL